jgi:crotonobetainyl-CoA:carnitine CoA-transferase CaiB-like acyl-CoA transferase
VTIDRITPLETRPLTGSTYRFGHECGEAVTIASFVIGSLGGTCEAAGAGGGGETIALSGYGPRGRFAAAPAHESAVAAIAGALMAQWTYRRGPAYLVTPYAATGQGLLAAAATLAAPLGPGVAPAGVSGVQGMFAVQSGAYAFGARQDPERWHKSPRGQWSTYSTFRAADDWLFAGASTVPFMLKVLEITGLDDLLADEKVLRGPQAAFADAAFAEEVRARIQATIERRDREHWLRIFQSQGVPAGPVLTFDEALAQPQLQAAGLVDGSGRLANPVRVVRRGAALPRPSAGGPLPLSGVRVVELAGYIAGSYTGRLLADLGAEVIKVEPPDGDPFRVQGYGFAAWNHGKRSLSLNLREPAASNRLIDLVRQSDVLVTNYRPDALDRMGVGREVLFEANPALVHCTLSAFGETGPLARLPGFDPVVQAFVGIMKRQGGDGDPVKPQIAATDYLAGMLGAIGVLAARTRQAEHGGGFEVTTSLLAAGLLLNYQAYADRQHRRAVLTGGRDFPGPYPLNGLHQTADGWLLTVADIAAHSGQTGAAGFLEHEARQSATEAAIATLQRLGVPAVPCLDPEALPAEPHFRDNNLWLTVQQPGLGEITFPAPVLHPATNDLPAPLCGQHNGSDAWT